MNPNFSEELQVMYRNILLQQHNIAYASMIAAFSSAAESSGLAGLNISSPNSASNSFTLDSDIPRDEIECDVEIILVKNLRESLKKLETNLNGLHGKKFGYREVIEMASARPAYPASPNSVLIKRNRTNSFGSPGSTMTITTPLTPTSIEKENESKRIRKESTSAHDESSVSSHDGSLHIDLNNTEADDEILKFGLGGMKMEKPDEESDQTDAVDHVMVVNEPTIEIKEANANEYKPAQLRIERLTNIQKKKPKFNIDSLDLTYHSNMARSFPGSENRTEDQQARRNKNTLAARISRTKNKAYEKSLEKQSLEATSANIEMKRKIACLRVYAASLIKMNGLPDVNFKKMWESNIKDIVGTSD